MLGSRISINNILPTLVNSRVLIRTDFNVPLKEGVVTNNKRIVETLPTLKKILEQNPKNLTIMSHLGRPAGNPNPKFSMAPVVPELEKLLGTKV